MKQTEIPKLMVPRMDRHNQTLVANVYPPDWLNPKPTSIYGYSDKIYY